MLDQVFDNEFGKILGFESEVSYVREVTLFLYALHVLKYSKKGSDFVSTFLLTYVRAFGAMGFALPLVLGGLPSDIIKQMDDYAFYVIAAQVYASFGFSRFLPKVINDLTARLNNLAYYIVKGNLAAQGFAAAGAAISDSTLAPFVGAFLAVKGEKFIENGVHAIGDKTFDEDGLLAIFSGVLIHFGGLYLELSAATARVLLVIFRWSNECVDWCGIYSKTVRDINNFASSATKKASSQKKKAMRGRSRTPMRK